MKSLNLISDKRFDVIYYLSLLLSILMIKQSVAFDEIVLGILKQDCNIKRWKAEFSFS